MLNEEPKPVTQAVSRTVELSDAEYAFFLRLRNLRKQAGDGLIQINLYINRSRIEMNDPQPVNREVFA